MGAHLHILIHKITTQKMDTEQPTLLSIASNISELAKALTEQLKAGNVAQPTFAADSPTRYEGLNGEMFMTRQKLLDAVTDMWFLTQGPSESIFNYAHTVSYEFLLFFIILDQQDIVADEKSTH